MNLKELQRQVAQCVMRPLTSSEQMKSVDENGVSLRKVTAQLIKPNDRLSSFERLEIYNRQYWFRILSCFYEDFPGLRAVMGDRPFEKMAEAYLKTNPSRSYTMRNLGSRLHQWLSKNPVWIRSCKQMALDMVALEWAHMEAFDAAEEPPLTTDDLLDLKGQNLKLKIQPYLQLLALEYPVDDFLLEIKKGSAGNNVASNAVTSLHKGNLKAKKQLKAEKVFLVIHRVQFSIYYKRLDQEAFLFLQALRSGKSLVKSDELAFRDSKIRIEERVALVQKWFQTWSTLGWFYLGKSVLDRKPIVGRKKATSS